MAIGSLLSQHQYKFSCDFNNSGKKGIKAVEARIKARLPPYKLILIDYSMPEYDGPTSVKRIRQILHEQGVPRD